MVGFGASKIHLLEEESKTPEEVWTILRAVHNVNSEDIENEDSKGYLQLADLTILEERGNFYLVQEDPTWEVKSCGGRVTYISPDGLSAFIQHDGLLCVVHSAPPTS